MKFVSLIVGVLLFAAVSFGQCPSVKVTGPMGITNPGEKIEFRVDVGVVGPRLQYVWEVDKGRIVTGQGTDGIVVEADKSIAGNSILATVEVSGLPTGCDRFASEYAGIAPMAGCDAQSDQWRQLKPNDERGRLDMFFAELANNPGQVGVMILEITHEEKLDSRNSRIQFVLKHAKFRKFDKSRIWFALELGDEQVTRLYRMLPETEMPCSGCLLFKGDSL
jgi:hypothetical protein